MTEPLVATAAHWTDPLIPGALWLGFWGTLGGVLLPLGNWLQERRSKIADAQELAGIRLFVAAEAADNVIFGDRVWSQRAFVASAIFTTATTFVLVAYCSTLLGLNTIENWQKDSIVFLIIGACVISLSNILFDFISVIATRSIIFELKRGDHSRTYVSFLIFLDVAASLFFAYFAAYILINGMVPIFTNEKRELVDITVVFAAELYGIFVAPFGEGNIVPLVTISLLTSLLTSIWLWLYMLGWGLANLLIATKRPVELFGGLFAPAAIGCFAVALLGLPFVFIW